MWSFLQPHSLGASYVVPHLFLTISGLLPYKIDMVERKFHRSWPLFTLTVLHMSFYMYANITLMYEDWEDYSQPVIGGSWITARINLLLRLLSLVFTICLFMPVLLGTSYQAETLNAHIELTTFFEQFGIDLLPIYHKIMLKGLLSCALMLCLVVFGSWHSIYFYGIVTRREPLFKYTLTIILSNYYKYIMALYVWLIVSTIHIYTQHLNLFLKTILRQQREQSLQKAIQLRV